MTQIGPGYLYVDDGSGLKDGTFTGEAENVGVRVICNPIDYVVDDRIGVTGISCCFKTNTDEVARCILTRGLGDLVFIF